ncbi:NAP domain-containing protein, partial [Acinetobacter baumannii]|uniref:NAP domain-containing protein n=1 Tax=Acinetobacter baumannii TaxID=470 RepID=UPI001111F4ED
IVVGDEEPTEEEINKGKEIEKLEGTGEEEGTETEPEEEKQAAQRSADVKGIPSFWLTALENLPVISDTITDRDAEVLDYLQDVQLQYL